MNNSVITKIQRRILLATSRFYSDRSFLEKMFPLRTGYKLDLDNPKTYNEKLQWLKLYNRNPLYTKMVDKIEAKDFVANIIGKKYIIPTLAVYEKAEDIDFNALPDSFVLKCSHDSGGIVICQDKSKLDKAAAIKKLKKGLKTNYYYQNREWPYKNVKPRIIAEQYMTDDGQELKDYKVFTFGGEPKIIEIDYNRFQGHLRNLYDTDWKKIDATIKYPSDPERTFDKPIVLEELLELSRKLSAGTPHLRTDFYIVNNNIFFGELTFFHESGMAPFDPEQFGMVLGDWICLPSPMGEGNF